MSTQLDQVATVLVDKGIPFKVSGQDYLIKCLNPEHEDSNPSMRIDKTTGVFHCLSCGFKGNVFKYFNLIVNINSIKLTKLREKLNSLRFNRIGLDVLDNSVPYTHSFRGISAKTLKEFGAFYTSDPKYGLEDRIIFPIKDVSGNTVVYQARHTLSDANPKYVFYPKNIKVPLFPQRLTERYTSIYLVEGLFDMLNLWDKGIKNVVCTFGTGSLLSNTKEKLLPFTAQGVTKIYLLFDGDKAGRDGMLKLSPLLEEVGYQVEIIYLNEGEDPGELSQEIVNMIKDTYV